MWYWVIGIVIVLWIFWPKGKKAKKKPARRTSRGGRSAPRRAQSARKRTQPTQRATPRPSQKAPSLEDLGFKITVSYDDGFGRPHGPVADPVWLGVGQSLKVGGVRIDDPMTYAASPKHRDRRCADPSQIAPWLGVHRRGESGGLSYWPWYERIEPAQRAVYLDWLASRRQGLPSEDGFLFIYYYGLERRALVDGKDIPFVVREVERLRGLHAEEVSKGRSRSFQRYSSSFLWYLVASRPSWFTEPDVRRLAEKTTSWNDTSLPAVLSWFAAQEHPCPAWLAMTVAGELPGSVNSVVMQRVPEQFERLFTERYRSFAGEGMVLRVSKRIGGCAYKPASAALELHTCEIANPLGIKSQFKPLVELWNGCVDDLRKLSRAADESDDVSIAEWEAMPAELRRGVEHPLTGAITGVVGAHHRDEGACLVPAQRMAEPMSIPRRERFTMTQSRRIAETAQHVGFGVEPDARLMGKSYRAEDPLAVFVWMYDDEPDGERYVAASIMMRFGLAVAEADGHVAPEELEVLSTEIARLFDLNDHEVRRLAALKGLLLAEGAEINAIGKSIRDGLSKPHRQAIGRLLIAIAAADGVIHPAERKVLHKCYRAIGLEPVELDQTLEAMSGSADGLVTVEPGARPKSGEPIPAPDDEPEITLDRDAIRRIMVETQEVSVLLAEAMGAAVAEEPEPPETTAGVATQVEPIPEPTSASRGPGGRFGAFYEVLVSKDRWDRDELDAVAREQGHMLGGAIEAVNDWAYEEFGTALTFEDEGTIVIERGLIAEG